MASSVKHFCTICHDDGISNRAVTWCTECEVLFCEDCEKPHSKSRLSKNHKIMTAEDYHNLPTFMQEISSQCKDHKKKFELYCSFHACPCCVQCITEHQKCQDLKPLSDILKHVKSSASVQLFEKDLKVVKDNLDTAITYIKTRISTINNQKTKVVEEILYIRKSLNDYLNKLEQDILNDLESKHSKLKSDMSTLLQQMGQRASQINQMQSQFTIITQYATELQIYIGLQEIEKTTSETTKYIEDLESEDYFSEKNLEVNISSSLQSILHDVKSFGDININTTSSTLQIKTGRKDQAQNLIVHVPGIEKIKPFFNDGIVIRVVVIFTESPYDACFTKNNTVAVTLGLAKHTTLVDIEKNKIIQTIKFSHSCHGAASDGETLVISSRQRRCTRVNLNDMSHTALEGMEGVGFIALFQGNIYGTILFKNKVCCFNSTGEPLWIFQHQDINRPVGIALDKNGCVYIASIGNSSIAEVSSDGKTCKTILSEADGIEIPYSIDINKEAGIMIVSSDISADRKNHKTAFCL
ncbi:unnamed protein product [Mytilus edulis]|uniref:B box-type domain-containing protein n=1 Tax=Mytilus edulis TaxID=6550 RepID=A0A8S3S5X4_MYTED|nr:unnamed protein product [Mytilus edulis]